MIEERTTVAVTFVKVTFVLLTFVTAQKVLNRLAVLLTYVLMTN